MSQHKQDKHTPSDNGRQHSQNGNHQGVNHPKTSGKTDFDDTQREAFEGRESGLNESGRRNQPTRDRDGLGANSDKKTQSGN